MSTSDVEFHYEDITDQFKLEKVTSTGWGDDVARYVTRATYRASYQDHHCQSFSLGEAIINLGRHLHESQVLKQGLSNSDTKSRQEAEYHLWKANNEETT